MKKETIRGLSLIGGAVLLGGFLLAISTPAMADCVYSGGGWICHGSQPPSEPGELPTVEPTMPPVVIETPEPTVEPAPVVETSAPAPAPVAPAPEPAPPVCVP